MTGEPMRLILAAILVTLLLVGVLTRQLGTVEVLLALVLAALCLLPTRREGRKRP